MAGHKHRAWRIAYGVLGMAILSALAGGCGPGPTVEFKQRLALAEGLRLTNAAELSFVPVALSNALNSQWLKPPQAPSRLAPGDVVRIEPLGEPGPPAAALVGPDGKLYYDLLPGTLVWGLTVSEVQTLLETNLGRYLRQPPQLRVTLQKAGSQRVWVLGHVQHPGVYSLAAPLTVLDALAQAGGLAGAQEPAREAADLRRSFVMREGQLLPVDLHELKGDPGQNIYVQGGDFIYVRSGLSPDIFVLGTVRLPNVVPAKAGSSLLQVIASVGGPLGQAYLSRVAILRGSLSRPTMALVNYQDIAGGRAFDARLEPGDIVYVPSRPVQNLEQLAAEALNAFARAMVIRGGQSVPPSTP